MDPLVLICSVPLEAETLLANHRLRALNLPRLQAWEGQVGRCDIYLVVGGMGKTNAAHALTAILENRSVSRVIGFGVGGAYPGRGLAVGDLAVATSEHYGDEGVETPQGWISCEGIGIPLLEAGGTRHFNDFPTDPEGVQSALHALSAAGLKARAGGFATVSTCSGTTSRGRTMAERFDVVCETMEGAAYAHVAALYQLPFMEIRGVSNMVEDRNMGAWQLRSAASAAADAVAVILEALCESSG